MKKFSLLFLLLSFMTLSISCGGDDDDNNTPTGCTASFIEDYATELNNIGEANTNYFNDMTQENCDALKDAYNAYLDALESWEDCANFYNQVTEWQAAIDETRANIDDIC